MAAKNLEELLVDGLKDIYDAEKRITKALPKMMKQASSEELASAFEEHLEQTEEQIARLDQVFEELGKAPGRKVCDAMVGLTREAEKHIEESEEGPVRDAAMIGSAQKVEHYEMATYGTLRDWAQKLGQDSAAKLLQQTLEEEEETDKRLTQIAQALNLEAAEEDEDEGRMAVASKRPASRGSSAPRGRSTGGTRSTRARGRAP